MRRNLILSLACSLAAGVPMAAQTGTPSAPATLDARMQAFLREIAEEPNTALAAFFPRRGDWTWVQTLRDERGRGERTGTWRFPGAETPRAIGDGGPACESFDGGGGIDNLVLNERRGNVPESGSSAALAGLVALVFASVKLGRRRRV